MRQDPRMILLAKFPRPVSAMASAPRRDLRGPIAQVRGAEQCVRIARHEKVVGRDLPFGAPIGQVLQVQVALQHGQQSRRDHRDMNGYNPGLPHLPFLHGLAVCQQGVQVGLDSGLRLLLIR